MLHRELGVTSRASGYLSPLARRLIALLRIEGPTLLKKSID